MKQLSYLLFLLPVLALSQSTEQNYIKTTTYRVATLNGVDPAGSGTALTDANKIVNIGYFDGLGRPIQQIAYKQSAEGKNIIVPIVYDALGRKTKDYLPFPSQSTSLLYTDNSAAVSSLETFYLGQFPSEGQNPYSEKLLESSPLNRVQKQAAPGTDWKMPVLPANPDHTIRFDYLNNNTNEVRLFTATSSTPSAGMYDISLANAGYYLAGQLFKTKVKDENWKTGDNNNNTTDEFKDKQGRVVLKRSYESGEAYDTYYVYDQYGNLAYVIPPKVDTGSTLTDAVKAGLCYQYKYDSRNRLVEKRLPGKQWEYIVYDRLDRVVATGPANAPFSDLLAQGKKGWLITKYDAFNRTVLTAWKEATFTTTTRKTLQDLYDGAAAAAISEKRTASATVNTTMNGVAFNYTNVAEPTAGYHLLTVNYYDNYDFTSSTEWVPAVLPTESLGEPVYYNRTLKPKGLATGSWVRVLETSTLYKDERSYVLYDVKSRPILNFKRNHLVGYDFNFTKYDFEGKVLQTQTTHRRFSGSAPLTVTDNFTYTDQGRLLLHTHKIGGGALQLLARNEYDKLGQLKSKKVGGTDTSGLTSMQKVDYSYNIRGWLKGINNMQNLVQSGDPKDLFAFAINYNTVSNSNNFTSTPLFNGNISETYWKTSGDNRIRKYAYRYDNLSRLREAVYMRPETPSARGFYDESMWYDKNGNIMGLTRNGYLDADSGLGYEIDDLVYAYGANSNQLLFAEDKSNSWDGFKDGSNPTPERPDYDYDLNGNMTSDWNKGIEGISYNHLNLPVKITFKVDSGHKYIEYLYNAVGLKLGKRVLNDSPNGDAADSSVLYLGGFQYTGDDLQLFPTSEGYVSVTGTSYNYVFNYTDHLGNVRLGYTKDPVTGQLRVLEENHYYPYGMKHSNYGASSNDYARDEDNNVLYAIIKPVERGKYQYRYNGKEWQDELGLNLYDMPFRDYDPAIARWTGIDPVTHHSMSPYNAFDGNPVFWADPSGADSVDGMTFTGSAAIDAYNAILGAMNSFGDSGWSIFGLEINNPLNTEISESGPGAYFSSALAAAIDFGNLYNGYSIINHTEVGTLIYSVFQNSTKKYAYATPIVGTGGFIMPDQMQKILNDIRKMKMASLEALAHTHGSEDSPEVKKGLARSQILKFSGDYYNYDASGDIAVMKNRHGNIYGRPIDGYLAAPDGGLYYFSPDINYTNTRVIIDGERFFQYQIPVYSGLPSDSGLTNDIRNERRNTIDPVVIPNLKLRY